MEIENEVTIATHNGSQVARQHNLRNPNVICKEDHSVNHPEWKQPFVKANTPYHSETEYRFV